MAFFFFSFFSFLFHEKEEKKKQKNKIGFIGYCGISRFGRLIRKAAQRLRLLAREEIRSVLSLRTGPLTGGAPAYIMIKNTSTSKGGHHD
ncbi:MAG: hypothetical protein ACI4NL_00860 [Christensenellales bacterium]